MGSYKNYSTVEMLNINIPSNKVGKYAKGLPIKEIEKMSMLRKIKDSKVEYLLDRILNV